MLEESVLRAGKVKVPDVMFPEGSPHLVEPIYKNPMLSAPFNVQLAAAVRTFVEDRLQVPSLHYQQFHLRKLCVLPTGSQDAFCVQSELCSATPAAAVMCPKTLMYDS